MSAALKNNRRHIRFKPDAGALAAIDIDCGSTFLPRITAKVLNESFSGCCVLALGHLPLCPGNRIRIRVGRMDVLPAEVRWLLQDGNGEVRLGLMYLDPPGLSRPAKKDERQHRLRSVVSEDRLSASGDPGCDAVFEDSES